MNIFVISTETRPSKIIKTVAIIQQTAAIKSNLLLPFKVVGTGMKKDLNALDLFALAN